MHPRCRKQQVHLYFLMLGEANGTSAYLRGPSAFTMYSSLAGAATYIHRSGSSNKRICFCAASSIQIPLSLHPLCRVVCTCNSTYISIGRIMSVEAEVSNNCLSGARIGRWARFIMLRGDPLPKSSCSKVCCNLRQSLPPIRSISGS